jgi:glycosyltransferase involved in cell wall biosynthesis
MLKKTDYVDLLKKQLEVRPTQIACVIPVYNEEGRVSQVLEVVSTFPFLDELIVVNDGSTDGSVTEIKTFSKDYPSIRLLHNKTNLGKIEAVKKGISATNCELVVLVDADLRNFTHQDLAKLIYFVVNGEYDMTIIDRGGDRLSPQGFLASLINRLNGGERAFWKKEFHKIDFIEREYGYLLEQIMNLYYVKNELKVRTIYAPNLRSSWQFAKKGWRKGWKVYKDIHIKLYQKSGIKGFYLQVGGVEEDRLEPLYKLYNKSKNYKKLSIILVFIIAIVGIIASLITSIKLNLIQLTPLRKK